MKKLSVIFLASVVLCSCAGNPATTLPPPQDYTEGEALFLKGDFAGAYHKFSVFATRGERSPYVSDASYWAGMSALELGDGVNARKYLQRAYKRPRSKQLGGMALAGLADCDFEDGRFSVAAARYKRALPWAGIQRPRLLYQLGLCYDRTGKLRDANRAFEEIFEDYPDSSYASSAREKAGIDKGDYSVQVAAFETRSNADKLRGKLESRGFCPHLKLNTTDGKVFYCVRVGRYGSWKEAEPVLKQLRAAGFDGMIVP